MVSGVACVRGAAQHHQTTEIPPSRRARQETPRNAPSTWGVARPSVASTAADEKQATWRDVWGQNSMMNTVCQSNDLKCHCDTYYLPHCIGGRRAHAERGQEKCLERRAAPASLAPKARTRVARTWVTPSTRSTYPAIASRVTVVCAS